MKKKLLLFTSPLLLLISLIFKGSGDVYVAADFVGSDACAVCHADQYGDWEASGHPYKFTVTPGNEGPVYPAEAINFQSQWMDSLGDGSHTWDDVAGVIGGYGWKARFVGTDGYIIGTAGSSFPDAGMGHNQFNFYGGEDHGWVDYDASKTTKLYNYGCFKCHTTGGDTAGTWLIGVDGLGTFTEGGIGCESCHGPGGDHIVSGSKDDIDMVYEFAHMDNSIGGLQIGDEIQSPDPEGNDVNFLCGTCHNRDYKSPINASGGFVKHHEQWDEFVATTHGATLSCSNCHNPHKRVIWDGDGITSTCESCHADETALINHPGTTNCIDCHMPFAAKSGTKRGKSGFVGDVRSHLMAITPDTASMFTADGAWVRDDSARSASLSPAYSCLGCHNNDPDDNIPDKTLEAAALSAANMHSDATSVSQQAALSLGIYPNPSSGPTVITFTLARTANVSLQVFNTGGQMVYKLTDERRPAGSQLIQWNSKSNTGAAMESGYYFVKLTAGNLTSVQKLVMMK
jgi:hypothetical protein